MKQYCSCHAIGTDSFIPSAHAVEVEHLRRLIEGKRVLVLGSGPSARTLTHVPEDVLIFSCNMGPLMLIKNNLQRHVDVYLVNQAAFRNYQGHIEHMLSCITVGTLLSRDLAYIKSKRSLVAYQHLYLDRTTRSAFYLEELIRPHVTNEILVQDNTMFTSTGVGLIQYALYFGASEIFLSGIDLNIDQVGHVLVSSQKKGYYYHKKPDQNFLSWVQHHRNNVFALSSSSPIAQTLPVRSF